MPTFVSCDKQVSSLASALSTSTTTDKTNFATAAAATKAIASAETNSLKYFSFGNNGRQFFDIAHDTVTNSAFGSWNSAKTAFTFSISGNYLINATGNTVISITRQGPGGVTGAWVLVIGGRAYEAGSNNAESNVNAQTLTSQLGSVSIPVQIAAGTILKLQYLTNQPPAGVTAVAAWGSIPLDNPSFSSVTVGVWITPL